jgi:AcrR family transcriptional regulator
MDGMTRDGRRARGDASRRLVLSAAADLASVEGLDQLSIGRIADAASVSKSNLTTLFGTRERLQLATVAAARETFVALVVSPARLLPRGTERILHLIDGWIAYSRDRAFPGGCFFAAAAVDFDTKPGAVRDAVAQALHEWEGYLAASLRLAREQGELPRLEDEDQAAFEYSALLEHANRESLMRDSPTPYARARRAVGARLREAGARPELLDPFLAVRDDHAERLMIAAPASS